MGSIEKLLEIMAALREPTTGCPWDLEQDFSTIAPYTIEEAYEVADAIEREDMPALRDELGDLLFQVVFTRAWPRKRVSSTSKTSRRVSARKCCDVIRTFSVMTRNVLQDTSVAAGNASRPKNGLPAMIRA